MPKASASLTSPEFQPCTPHALRKFSWLLGPSTFKSSFTPPPLDSTDCSFCPPLSGASVACMYHQENLLFPTMKAVLSKTPLPGYPVPHVLMFHGRHFPAPIPPSSWAHLISWNKACLLQSRCLLRVKA